jgi:nucleoside-diphosphate-sugar epimerase
MPMRILLLGGNGFLSGHVLDAARRAGHDITVVTRGKRPVPAGVRAVVADRTDRVAFARAIAVTDATWDLVVDGIGFNAADAQQDVDVLLPRCGHLVFVSTDFVYTRAPRPFPVSEAFDGFETQIAYGRGKREAEVILLNASPHVTVLRPCHIYGAGSLLGCLPHHGRDAMLIDRLRTGEPLTLIGGGHFLQQPVYAPDLATMILSAAGNDRAKGEVFHAAGPDVVESKAYYEIIARHLQVDAQFVEAPIDAFLARQPDRASFCSHRVYTMEKARSAGLTIPATPLVDGLAAHVKSLHSPTA